MYFFCIYTKVIFFPNCKFFLLKGKKILGVLFGMWETFSMGQDISIQCSISESKTSDYESFSSPEPKAQLSFSDPNFYDCPSLSLSSCVGVVINFSHIHLLLQNHWANFNQTWHKASLSEGDSSLFKWKATPFSKER